MKRLKFFMHHIDSLRAAEFALTEVGISHKKLHIFERNNIKRRYDGLILASRVNQDYHALSASVILMVFMMIFGVVGMYYQWFSFATFAALFGCLLMLPLTLRVGIYQTANSIPDQRSEKVYFLVIDVDEKDELVVTDIVKSQRGLACD